MSSSRRRIARLTAAVATVAASSAGIGIGLGGTALAACSDPTTSGFQLNGSAVMSGSDFVLTPNTQNLAGDAVARNAFDPNGSTVTFSETMDGGGQVPDGITVTYFDATMGGSPSSLGASGGDIGAGGIATNHGVTVTLDSFMGDTGGDPSDHFVGVANISNTTRDLQYLTTSTTNVPTFVGTTNTVSVSYSNGSLSVSINGQPVLTYAITLPSSAYLGFTSGTGAFTGRHVVRQMQVLCSSSGPSPVVPEVPFAALLPVGALAGAGVWFLRRRRRTA